MAKTLDQLPTLGQPLVGTDYVLVKAYIDGSPFDFKVTKDTLLQGLVTDTQIGTNIGDLVQLVDDGGGNPSYPALDGSLITNITFPTGTGIARGTVFLSDAIDSSNGVATGFAATSKAVNDLNNLTVKLAGSTLTGDLRFTNTNGILLNNLAGNSSLGMSMTASDDLQIGGTTNTATNIDMYAVTAVKIRNTSGTEVFSFNTDGSIDGLNASGVTFTPAGNIAATDIQAALVELDNEKLSLSGGSVTGLINLSNNIALQGKDTGGTDRNLIRMTDTDFVRIGNNTYNVEVWTDNSFKIIDDGVTLFEIDSTGSTGLDAGDIAFSPSGSIAATNVQAAIEEVAAEAGGGGGGGGDAVPVSFDNNIGVQTRNAADSAYIDTIIMDASNNIKIGETGANYPVSIKLIAGTSVIFEDETGADIFTFGTDGSSSGIKAADVVSTAVTGIVATDVQSAIAELATEKMNLTGGSVTGDITLANGISINGLTTTAASRNLITMDTSNNVFIGDSNVSSVELQTNNGVINIKNGAGSVVYSFNTNGTVTGIDADQIVVSPTGAVSSINVQAAIAELDSEKLAKTGGDVTGQINLSNNVSLVGKEVGGANRSLIFMNNSDVVGLGNYANDVEIYTDNSFKIIDDGITLFEINSTGSSGLDAGDISFSPTGSISSTNVQAAIAEVAAEAGAAPAASTVTFSPTGNITASNVQAALAELDNEKLALSGGTVTGTVNFNSTVYINNSLRCGDYERIYVGDGLDGGLLSNGTNMVLGAPTSILFKSDAAGVGTTRFTFNTVNGDFTATGNVTAYSDKRLKKDFELIENALEKVDQISGQTYLRRDIDGPRQAGVIAQEIQAVLPEAVVEDEVGTLSVNSVGVIGLLIEAVKELKQEVAELKRSK